MVHEALPVLGEISDRGLFWSLLLAKLAIASLILVDGEHKEVVDRGVAQFSLSLWLTLLG